MAFGIGTSQVRDVLASQCLAMEPLKVRRIAVNGRLGRGVYAKDVILEIIRRLGVKGGAGLRLRVRRRRRSTRMSMDERMTICNMSIEGGARVGYVNPDQTTFDYLRGRPFAPQGDDFERATRWWAVDGVGPGRGVRRRGRDRRGGDTADGDLGHQSRASRSASTSGCRRTRIRKRSRSWASAPGSR